MPPRDYNIGVAPSTQVQNVFNMTLPSKGPKVFPLNLDFTTESDLSVDLSMQVQQGAIDFISGAWIDNSASSEDLTIICDGTKHSPIIPAGAQAFMPLLVPNEPKFVFSYAASPAIILPVLFYNIPLLPYMWDLDGGTISINWAGFPGLTDTELRASAVDINFDSQSQVVFSATIGNTGSPTDRSIANLSGASQTIMAANSTRRSIFIMNIAANNMGVNLVGGAAAIGTAGTVTLVPGASILLDTGVPLGAVNIIGTLNDDVTAWET